MHMRSTLIQPGRPGPFRLPVASVLLVVGFSISCVGGAGSQAAGAPPEPSGPSPDAPPTLRPGAPGEPSRIVAAENLRAGDRSSGAEADVRFMQGMIPHHAQALEMVDLIAERTDSEAFRRMGLRIAISQRDEIGLMQDWLRDRGREVPRYRPMLDREGRIRPGASGGRLMAGMLTPEQMQELARARGEAFHRLFLERMIRHHGGARIMVRDLLASPGAAQDPDIFQFASDVDADQMAEIARMRRMLRELRR